MVSLDIKQIKKDLISWNKAVLDMHDSLNRLNERFKELYDDIQRIEKEEQNG